VADVSRMRMGEEYADFRIAAQDEGERFVVAEAIQVGGPRDGDSKGWLVIDQEPEDPEGGTAFHFTGPDGTRADAEAIAERLRAEAT
jgi:hypothetical protein